MPRIRSLLSHFSSRAAFSDGLLRLLSLSAVCAVVYRYFWIDYQDPFKCSALLNNGSWLDTGEEWNSRRTFRDWQPPGCMLHEYEKEDIRDCLGQKRIVIIGDSTTRQVFWAISRKLDLGRAEREMEELLGTQNKAYDIDFTADGITVQFIWDPYLNSSSLTTELEAFRKSTHPESTDIAATAEDAGLILLGAPGLWYARKGGVNHVKGYKETLDRLTPHMTSSYSQMSYGDWSLPSLKDPARNILLMAPVRTPLYKSLSPSRRETLTPERIDPLNEHLLQLSSWQDADIAWSFANMTWQLESTYEDSGFHIVRGIADTEADVLLNLRCNAASAERGVYPHDGTCCMNYRRPDWRQRIIIFSTLSAALLLWINRRKYFLGRARFVPSSEVLRPFLAFALILCFCFFADRTQLFTKEHMFFVKTELVWACVITATIGAISIKKEAFSFRQVNSGLQSQQGQHKLFLSRIQTEEWKGLMQALLLIFHYTGAFKTLWAYELSQIFGAGYLFITGYGHTIYFLSTNDFSLNRVAHVLIRLNLFVCTLAYVMRTEYTFYHFAPLVSFWFGVVYYILRIKRSLNTQPTYLLLKIVLFGCVGTGIVLIPSVLESIFIILKFTFRVGWDVPQLRKLIYQNLLIVYVGMIFAVFSHRMSSLSIQPPQPSSSSIIDTPLKLLLDHSSVFKFLLAILALIDLPVYWIFTVAPHTKAADYDKFHPYLSFMPIFCYLALRNCNTHLQSYYSTIFAWLGRHSLELYLLQYHIWLAGDSRGILRLGIGSRGTEFVAITMLFLWTAGYLRDAVSRLEEWIISGRVAAVRRRRDDILGVGITEVHPDGWVDYSIPDEESTPSKSHGFASMGLWGDMRLRLVVVVMVAWFLNVTYT